MQPRTENRASPHPPGAANMNPALYQYSLGGHAYAPLPKDDLSQAFAGVNISGFNQNNGGRVNVPGMAPGMVPMPVTTGAQSPLYYAYGNRYLAVNGSSAPDVYQQGNVATTLGPQGQFVPSSAYGSHQIPSSAPGYVWTNGQQATAEPPELAVPRRNSFSSNEEVGPNTPFLGGHAPLEYQPRINTDNSPQAWATPSPQQLGPAYYPQVSMKGHSYMLYDLDALCQQDPPIPKPIPAIFSGDKGRGTLESSLMNKLNTTNVYIRGLHPNTTDEMLHAYGARFGTIDSAKAMMDQQQGTCKGFGFIKYHNFADGSNCIRGFYHWGYEAKWARVSHNEKLKNLADSNNTNLYVSGIPTDVDFNEHTLTALFGDHKCLSSKILRDTNGLSRGVGFARFETPDECHQIIEEYNNKPIGQDGNPISVRFADTADQKKLKMETQQRRHFKTTEYNMAAYGPNSPYHHLNRSSPIGAAVGNGPLHLNGSLHQQSPLVGAQWQPGPTQVAPLWQTPNGTWMQPYPSPVVQTSAPAVRTPGSENVAPSRRTVKIESPPQHVHVKEESPSVAALAKRPVASGNVQSPARSADKVTSATGGSYADLITSPVRSIKSSPSKRSPSKANLLGQL